MRGWGQPAFVDETLLRVRGFDPAQRRFEYEVNPGFGRLSPFRERIPFTVSLQARVVLGVDRPLASYHAARDAAANRAAALAPANLQLHYRSQITNVPAQVLALNGPARLYLEPRQAILLQQSADSLEAEIVAVITQLLAAVAAAPLGDADDFGKYRPLARER